MQPPEEIDQEGNEEDLIGKLVLSLTIFLVLLILLLLTKFFSQPSLLQEETLRFDKIFILVIISSLLFILTLVWFLKIVFIDESDNFGIESLISGKAVILGFMSVIFISLVYLFLDILLVDTYLIIGPVIVVFYLDEAFYMNLGPKSVLFIEYYLEMRNIFVIGLFGILLVFPIATLLLILTRRSRQTIIEKTETVVEDSKTVVKSIILLVVIPIVMIITIFLVSIFLGSAAGLILFFLVIALIFVIVFLIFRIIWKIFKMGTTFMYGNLLLVLPILMALYFVPVGTWIIWDLIETLMQSNTLMTSTELVESISYNLIAWDRIFLIDFAIIVGIAAIVIGFAEGYSIISAIDLVWSSFKGDVSPDSQTSSKFYALIYGLIILIAWSALLSDKFIWMWQLLRVELNFSLPELEIQFFMVYIHSFIDWFNNFLPSIFPIAVLLLPLYFIVNASFRFFSVRLATNRLEDPQYFTVLVSSAFVLIATQIMGDINYIALDPDNTLSTDAVPLASLQGNGIVPWVIKTVSYVEALAFFCGCLFMIYVGVLWMIRLLTKKYKEFPVIESEERITVDPYNVVSYDPSVEPKLPSLADDDNEYQS